MIPAESLEAIRSKIDITELIAEYVPHLQRAGRSMKARCPFHQERTPSFIASPERQTFHCFGCGEGGDAFAFLMKIENLSFTEAAEKLAARVGVIFKPLERSLGPEEKERLKIRELLDFAVSHYHELLLKSPQAQAVLDYLEKRGLSSGSLRVFRLGLAPRSGGLLGAAALKGFPRELLVKAGLAIFRGGALRDYFYDRILFPIRDAKGAVVGFGGRALGETEPKYLNSPDSAVFSKGRVLYGLFEGLPALRKSRQALLMEGYMDAIAAHQHGFSNACAPLGTALTPEHATVLKRYVSEVRIVFDPDSAGMAAAIRGAELLLAAGLEVRITTLPEGLDPDEHLQRHGSESFRKCLDSSVDLVEFKTERLLKVQTFPLSAQAKSQIGRDVLSTIGKCSDEILKGEWLRRLSQRLVVSEESLRREFLKGQGTIQRSRNFVPSAEAEGSQISRPDEQVLALLLKDPSLSHMAREEDFESPAARSLWRVLKSLDPLPPDWPAKLMDSLGPGERVAASRLLVLLGDIDSPDPAVVLRGILDLRRARRRLAEIEPQVLALGSGVLLEEGLRREYQNLLSQLKGTRRLGER
jgi:DNA primase